MAIAEVHIHRFTKWLTLPHAGVRVAECRQYLALWQSIKDKSGKNLTVPEGKELQDALDCEEYADLVSSGSTYTQRRCASEDVPFLTEKDV